MQSSSKIISLTTEQLAALLAIVPAVKNIEKMVIGNKMRSDRNKLFYKRLVDDNRSEILKLKNLPELSNYQERTKQLIATFMYFKSKSPDPQTLVNNEIQYVRNLLGRSEYVNICYESAVVRNALYDLAFDDLKIVCLINLVGSKKMESLELAFECFMALEDYLNWLLGSGKIATETLKANTTSPINPLIEEIQTRQFRTSKLLNGKIHPDWLKINDAMSKWGTGQLINLETGEFQKDPFMWKEIHRQYSLILFIKVIAPYIVKPEKKKTSSRWDYTFGKTYFRLPEEGILEGVVPNFNDTTKGLSKVNQNFMRQLKHLHDLLQEKIEWKL